MHLQKVLALHTHSMSPEEYELQPDVPSLMLGWRVGNSSDLRKRRKTHKKKPAYRADPPLFDFLGALGSTFAVYVCTKTLLSTERGSALQDGKLRGG